MDKRYTHYAWRILAACCAIQGVSYGIVLNASGVFFTPVATELGVSIGSISFQITILSLIMAFMYPVAAKVLEAKNIRVVLSTALIVVCVTFAATSRFCAAWQWYVAGIILGFSGAFMFVTLPALLINNWFHEKKGMATGITSSFSAVFIMIMNPLATCVIDTYGWRLAYVVLAAVLLVLALPWALFVVRFKPEDMGLEPYGAAPRESKLSPSASSTSAVAAAKKSPSFIFLVMFAGLMGFVAGFTLHFNSFAASLGLSSTIGATMVSASQVGRIIGNIGFGSLIDKIGVKKATYGCLSGIFVGMLIIIAGAGKIAAILVGACLFGLIQTFALVCLPLVVQHIFEPRIFGQMYSLVNMGSSLVGAFGASGIGIMYDVTKSYQFAWFVGSILCMLMIIFIRQAFSFAKRPASR